METKKGRLLTREAWVLTQLWPQWIIPLLPPPFCRDSGGPLFVISYSGFTLILTNNWTRGEHLSIFLNWNCHLERALEKHQKKNWAKTSSRNVVFDFSRAFFSACLNLLQYNYFCLFWYFNHEKNDLSVQYV